MRHLYFTFCIIFLFSALIGCGPEGSIEPNNPSGPSGSNENLKPLKLASYIETGYSGPDDSVSATFNFEYDNDNRTKSIKITSDDEDVAELEMQFTYPSKTKIVTHFLFADDNNVHILESLLNTKGVLDSTAQYDSDYPEEKTTEKYFYDAKGRLVKVNNYSIEDNDIHLEGKRLFEYNSDGYLIKETDTEQPTVTEFEYYDDLKAQIPYSPPVVTLDMTNKYKLVKQYKYNSTYVLDVKYKLDNLGRIIEETRYSGTVLVFKRQYFYK